MTASHRVILRQKNCRKPARTPAQGFGNRRKGKQGVAQGFGKCRITTQGKLRFSANAEAVKRHLNTILKTFIKISINQKTFRNSMTNGTQIAIGSMSQKPDSPNYFLRIFKIIFK